MKILLAGFSEQNAAALSVLIMRAYPEYSVVELERMFGASDGFCLPELPTQHQNAKIAVIEMSGVGLNQLPTNDCMQNLDDFVGNRVAVCVVRNHLSDWQQHAKNNNRLVWLPSPYNKADMDNALAKAVALAKNPAIVAVQDDDKKDENLTIVNEKVDCLHAILDTFFNNKPNTLLHECLDIRSKQLPFCVAIGSQTLYINRNKNMALVQNPSQVLGYCQLATDVRAYRQLVTITPLSFYEFNKIANQVPHNGYHKYVLNGLLWQMFDKILPETVDVTPHPLQLKIRLMPNFTQMPDTPNAIKVLTSACLLLPKTADELLSLGVADMNTINRLFLLAMLSGFADYDVLQVSSGLNCAVCSQSYTISSVSSPTPTPKPALPPSDEKPVSNQSVQTAKKSGFFGRLLSKLSFK